MLAKNNLLFYLLSAAFGIVVRGFDLIPDNDADVFSIGDYSDQVLVNRTGKMNSKRRHHCKFY